LDGIALRGDRPAAAERVPPTAGHLLETGELLSRVQASRDHAAVDDLLGIVGRRASECLSAFEAETVGPERRYVDAIREAAQLLEDEETPDE
jgi:hypothetical protein